ncbi:unnamed protein product [Acanthoscelides obtectus]|uniref:small monomeric GTPase n=1 Tax=Acanthoscelides obtectus TaxID=200917 RepID=A0A9P0KPS2_ACAOB|nr:unnamed protein product [Acanthoscelides obtectus]CAK1664777.1 Ras-related and estrogen-regulated growth inhibitor [Acanthoscelides obtectus]
MSSSPKSSLAKLGLYPKPKTLKVMVLGQAGVGKSALVVRFITRRYIGEYDPTLEKIYTFHTVLDDEMVSFDILDTAGQPHVWDVFRDVCSFWRVHSKNPSRLKRSVSEKEPISLDTIRLLSSAAVSPTSMTSCNYKPGTSGLRWTEEELEEETESSDGKQESSSASSPGVESPPFRERASTDGHIHKRPWRWRNPPPASSSSTSSADHQFYGTAKAERRMSISMRGSNASC